MKFEVFIGFEPRQALAWKVACASLQARSSEPVSVRPIWRQQLERSGVYSRPHDSQGGVLWDRISGQPCSTEFSIARFGVPLVARAAWALFVDVDFLFRADVLELLGAADPRYAVMVVKHQQEPAEDGKMDGQVQRQYPRKNWSSCMLWNLEHPANGGDWSVRLNTWPRDMLHAFAWLQDEDIGELPETWNWLDGYSDPRLDPKAVHFTRGTPDMPGYEHTRYAPEWNRYAKVFMEAA